MHGKKIGMFADYDIDTMEKFVCSVDCAITLVDGYLTLFKENDKINVTIINNMDISLNTPAGTEELYLHLNAYLTQAYMKQYPMQHLRTKDMISIPELKMLHVKVIDKCKQKRLEIREDFGAM